MTIPREEVKRLMEVGAKIIAEERDSLYTICSEFIAEQKIVCPETIYQTDRVIENSLPLIEKICRTIGYAQPEE